MSTLHIASIDPTKNFARQIGKKTNETDYAIYNLKQGETVLCLYEPHRFPEKIQSLLGSINSSDFILWVIDRIDEDFAEAALAIWLCKKPGIMVFTQNIAPEQVEPMLKNSPMHKWEKLSNPDINELRQKLLALSIPAKDSPKLALVDACFAVGGVGTVALTKVLSGTFNVHDELVAVPGKEKTSIRSIQEQDIDVKSTSPSSRAGLALKNTSPEKIKRGSYLSDSDAVKQFRKGKIKFAISPLVRDEISNSSELFFAWDLQYVSVKILFEKITAKDGEKEFSFELASDAAALENQPVLIARNSKRPRIVGAGTISSLQ
ncbi:MAG: EF-Tu/IF-2/RF-3 family GTPase [Candidatus Micrarchaeia archaeon]